MKDNKDYITGLKEARKMAANMTNMLRLKTGGNSTKVFPYRYISQRIFLSCKMENATHAYILVFVLMFMIKK